MNNTHGVDSRSDRTSPQDLASAEVAGLPFSASLGTNISTGRGSEADVAEPIQEAVDRKVSELDLAAYDKDDFTQPMIKKIMSRLFSAFDVTHLGYLTPDKVEEVCRYLGRNMSDGDVKAMKAEINAIDGHVTFEKFWAWWCSHPVHSRTKCFSMVSADFSMPYHQQQLVVHEKGEMYTPSYRVLYFFRDLETGRERQVSPWHDIPLYVRDLVRTKPEATPMNRYNFICEIPKWTRAKFEIATGESFNPIKQDIKNGVPRFYKHGDMMWNYGAFPQTWESTEVLFEAGVTGDNDPVDAVEIGMTQFKVGQVSAVKVLGVLGMIDEGKMDWKVVCISHNDPICRFMKDIHDVPKFLPGCLDAIREWFRVYKICQGGEASHFAFDGEFKDKEYAMKVIDESHNMWHNLLKVNKRGEL
ncbi:acidocalcisomal pyrophosphatase, putative [Trypanosoma brucei gambiense DAL972]|uniref:inorganic diphosphatase n=3 Tax=Trypanosoma brucei TaxID=5691 RepID=Q384W5_TRYB2|nr:acidocalcisomal pyrophosphatase, putative [Trypanosoma brucei gambiense DAL972]XP_828778.1 acidocalcisomal pyrophosphatase [Trypanosoma brucei brucei TREU927]EAN79666.1 acidocalcisomal pyrophosphatase [Trypanosoma brucei brucei TREU927]CBH17681.1 acidocalcisomal pyrophosphatase, putative [Trypanosoma brucei gambiense DAL972]|eukprot:XP_011779945.1 acidocalcisomal pyrophosphatase, putative [Trypanosoma brucei gambiense DAL972]